MKLHFIFYLKDLFPRGSGRAFQIFRRFVSQINFLNHYNVIQIVSKKQVAYELFTFVHAFSPFFVILYPQSTIILW